MRRKPYHPQRSLDDKNLPKYSIAVASSLSGVPEQQLRRMEESGLLSPERTDGNTRRYSDEDIAQIAELVALANAGINAAGMRHILTMQAGMDSLRAELEALRAEVASLREHLAEAAASSSPSVAKSPAEMSSAAKCGDSGE